MPHGCHDGCSTGQCHSPRHPSPSLIAQAAPVSKHSPACSSTPLADPTADSPSWLGPRRESAADLVARALRSPARGWPRVQRVRVQARRCAQRVDVLQVRTMNAAAAAAAFVVLHTVDYAAVAALEVTMRRRIMMRLLLRRRQDCSSPLPMTWSNRAPLLLLLLLLLASCLCSTSCIVWLAMTKGGLHARYYYYSHSHGRHTSYGHTRRA